MNRDYMLAGLVGACAGICLGTSMMFLLDPSRGRKRRAVIRDKTVPAVHTMQNRVAKQARNLSNKVYGLGSEMGSMLKRDKPSDETLLVRVRSRLGRIIDGPPDLDISCADGCVTVRGTIADDMMDSVVKAIEKVKGVKGVDNQLIARQQSNLAEGI